MQEENVVKRKRGRPPGVKARPAPSPLQPEITRLVPPPNNDIRDYRHADPVALIDRQFAIIDWAQQAIRNEMTTVPDSSGKPVQTSWTGKSIADSSVKKITELSNALARNIEALKKHQDMAEEMAKRMTPEQLLEAALRKLEGQDLKTLNYAIKRLRAHRERLAPIPGTDRRLIGYDEKATDAIASLEVG